MSSTVVCSLVKSGSGTRNFEVVICPAINDPAPDQWHRRLLVARNEERSGSGVGMRQRRRRQVGTRQVERGCPRRPPRHLPPRCSTCCSLRALSAAATGSRSPSCGSRVESGAEPGRDRLSRAKKIGSRGKSSVQIQRGGGGVARLKAMSTR